MPRVRLRPLVLGVVVLALVPALAGATPRSCEAAGHDHCDAAAHAARRGFRVAGITSISDDGGLGRIEIAGKTGAVLQRDEGIVTLLNLRSPSRPRVMGRFDDGAVNSLDGDLAFSDDAEWLFYARQTVNFSRDGLHVLDVSDPAQPIETAYEPQGGMFRVAYHRDDSGGEWVATLDATHGLVMHRFVRPVGVVVPVWADPLPVLKVGGPASAGITIVRDKALDTTLMYVTTGRTGLDVYDIGNPAVQQRVGQWRDVVGLAEVEVTGTGRTRTIYAATEYWFDASLAPEVIVLDAADLGAIEERSRFGVDLPPEDLWRLQGMDAAGGLLFVAHSHGGVVAFDAEGRVVAEATVGGAPNDPAGAPAAPFTMDVEATRGVVYATDAASGDIAVLVLKS